MEQNNNALGEHPQGPGKKSFLHRLVIIIIIIIILISLIAAFCAFAFIYNNFSFTSDETFAKHLDEAIKNSELWVVQNRDMILSNNNSALFTMLRNANDIYPNPVFKEMVKTFLDQPVGHYTVSWKKEVDPDWPVSSGNLNRAIRNEAIDYKWMLYAIAPDQADITPEKMNMFDPRKWKGRKLTHQLFALTLLKRSKGPGKELDGLIEHLSDRIVKELTFDLAVVDIYIQKVAFVLRAGFPEKIKRRWVERIIDNQRPDGGWNDRWFGLTSARRPKFDSQSSTDHATVQAVIALYRIKYQYPEYFDLK
jgi:hypothetical protein